MVSFRRDLLEGYRKMLRSLWSISTLGVLAALIYNSWPLGYILNPGVARIGLASDLEAAGEAYNWLFISGDVLFGLVVLVIIGLFLKKKIILTRQVALVLLGFAVFGVLTAVSAVLPVNCSSSIRTCGYQGNQALGVHDLIGAIAALGLFIGMMAAWRLEGTTKRLKRWDGVVLAAWSVWGLLFTLTPIANADKLPHIQQIAIIWQQVFLILSGVGTYLIVATTEKHKSETPPATPEAL
jgi:hypothetical protein